RFDWVQNSYNLLDRADETEMLPLCRDQALGYTPFSPLAGGLLTGKYKLEGDYPSGSRMTLRPEPYLKHWKEKTFGALENVKDEAGRRGVSMAGLALAWVMNHPDVTAPIIGPRKIEHFTPVKEALPLKMSQVEWKQIAGLLD